MGKLEFELQTIFERRAREELADHPGGYTQDDLQRYVRWYMEAAAKFIARNVDLHGYWNAPIK
jgi:hypothetical protein